MLSFRPYVIALTLFVLPLAAKAAEEAQFAKVRANNAEFRLPSGWTRTSIDTGNTVFMPPDLPRNERVELHVGQFDPDSTIGIVEDAKTGVPNNAKDFPDIKFTGPVKVTRHSAGPSRTRCTWRSPAAGVRSRTRASSASGSTAGEGVWMVARPGEPSST